MVAIRLQDESEIADGGVFGSVAAVGFATMAPSDSVLMAFDPLLNADAVAEDGDVDVDKVSPFSSTSLPGFGQCVSSFVEFTVIITVIISLCSIADLVEPKL